MIHNMGDSREACSVTVEGRVDQDCVDNVHDAVADKQVRLHDASCDASRRHVLARLVHFKSKGLSTGRCVIMALKKC